MSNESIEDAMEWAKGGQFKNVLRREILLLRKALVASQARADTLEDERDDFKARLAQHEGPL